MNQPVVKFRVVGPHGKDLPFPDYKSGGAAGIDLYAAAMGNMHMPEYELQPMRRVLVHTGVEASIPKGWEGQIRPRSGLALAAGLTVLNAPGTIDSDYRGEIGVILINLGSSSYILRRGERIAQLVIASVARANMVIAAHLDDTDRGVGGFGSTGMA